MEAFGAFLEGEWDCFRSMFATEEHGYSPQFLGRSSPMLGEEDGLNTVIQSTFGSAPEAGENESIFYSSDVFNSNLQYVCQESSYSNNCSGDTIFIANSSPNNYYFSNNQNVPINNSCMSMDICMMGENNTGSFTASYTDIAMEATVSLNEDGRSDRLENSDHSQAAATVFAAEQLQLKRKLQVPGMQVPAEDKINMKPYENTKKKPRVGKDVQKCKLNERPKEYQKKLAGIGFEAEETNTEPEGQSHSSYSSEDDNGGATSASKSPAKTRAGRGSATDPQSLYARKRRERINERLRTLQNLVPNGTKVDISTMLEEAVQYVKFLQLQIKLLSSDDLWMYAAVVYNGVDFGLNLSQKICFTL